MKLQVSTGKESSAVRASSAAEDFGYGASHTTAQTKATSGGPVERGVDSSLLERGQPLGQLQEGRGRVEGVLQRVGEGLQAVGVDQTHQDGGRGEQRQALVRRTEGERSADDGRRPGLQSLH